MYKILVFLMMLVSLQMYGGTTSVDAQAEKDVKLEKGNSDKKDRHPRTLIPIVCVYVDGEVRLTLLEDLGEMTLTVSNQTTGEQWSAMNALRLQTSTVTGTYLVQITTEDGSTYYGTYTL